MGTDALMSFATALTEGSIRIVDLTVTLDPNTPVLQLPEEFGWGQAWAFSSELISRYDEKGPAWYWNNFKCSEHTGTHFDAPIHWISGKDHEDHATDTLPMERFVAPAVVLDACEEVRIALHIWQFYDLLLRFWELYYIRFFGKPWFHIAI